MRKAIARYLPSVGISGLATFIDEDRANPMFGAYERALTGKLKVSQVIVSEPALAGISIQRSVQRGRKKELEQLGLDHLLATGGATPDMSALGALAGAFPQADDTSWNVGLLLSWSLFEGGAKLHRHRQESVKLDGLLLQRRALAQDLEQRIRSAVHQAGGTYPGIALSNTAAASARKSLALVTEAYSRGTANITTLIDAQNAALNAKLAAGLARCDFYLDFFAAQRAIANRAFFTDGDTERQSWFRKLAAYQASRRAK